MRQLLYDVITQKYDYVGFSYIFCIMMETGGVTMADRTKLWIAEQMRELMKKKPIDQIRITEICSAAGIDRSTFYYHFEDKYALVAWIFYHTLADINILDMQEAADSMKRMKNDILFYKRAYEQTTQNALWEHMLEYFVEGYSRIAKEKLHTDVLDVQLAYSIRLYCYGAVGMSKEWILEDNITSAETAIRMMFASMPESLRKIYFGTPE